MMGYNQRGKKDGTGPFRDSYQREQADIGRRKEAGEACPAETKKSTRGSKPFSKEEISRGYRKL